MVAEYAIFREAEDAATEEWRAYVQGKGPYCMKRDSWDWVGNSTGEDEHDATIRFLEEKGSLGGGTFAAIGREVVGL